MAAAVGVSTSGKLVQVGSLSVVGVVIRAASVARGEEQRKAGLSFVSWLDSHSSVGPDSLLSACFLLDKNPQLVRTPTPLPGGPCSRASQPHLPQARMQNKASVVIGLSGRGLKDLDLFSKSDPYVVISR